MSGVSEQRCRLCGNQATLCKSHIVPEFLYAPLYDKEHRFIEVRDVSRGVVGKAQKGYWERLLCIDCESQINRFEKHARRLFQDPLPSAKSPSTKMRFHARLDYGLLKLFFLSILWRASISSLPTYKHVRLGPHEAKIQKMLLAKNPGGFEDYATMIFALHFNGEHLRDYMVEPTYMRVEGRRCYRLVMTGFVIFIFVASLPAPDPFPRLVLHPERPVQSFDSEIREFPFLREMWAKVAETTKDVVI